ncbi:DUF747-domain-containing protein [Patellaria atrata CBS 101060]|uniref:DUF747-domain-containing protein n=1 Tax=Patellaria atrata CBS 101060 TaxID=1346257 RepID=A0A9P4S7T8_9PEZI|nr:DUF747-domain-containing protein [Patellaria atrata CBS 101060]
MQSIEISEDQRKRNIAKISSPPMGHMESNKVLKLSPAQIQELTSSPSSAPLRPVSSSRGGATPLLEPLVEPETNGRTIDRNDLGIPEKYPLFSTGVREKSTSASNGSRLEDTKLLPDLPSIKATPGAVKISRPLMSSRAVSTPPVMRRRASSNRGPAVKHDSSTPKQNRSLLPSIEFEDSKNAKPNGSDIPSREDAASPMPPTIPLPPMSMPTYLQLELSSERPPPVYIHRSATSDFPYESSKVKFERLLNFLILPPMVERVLWFGALACLDAWLYTFTILPLRFLKALILLARWWSGNAVQEAKDLAAFVYRGLGRLWRRRKARSDISTTSTPAGDKAQSRRPSLSGQSAQGTASLKDGLSVTTNIAQEPKRNRPRAAFYRHRRTKSTPSLLTPNHKADILKGLLVLSTCFILMRFDASRMYHGIRGQAAIKLYVIYNVLEVCDRLFSAIGQDVLECLFSRETLERNADGRSKILRPFWMFLLALTYTVIHSTALFYQVITLNVAVNSYSNALLTLLMSNQFVEIKGTVFKKFEKENLFQLTCADVVERFQLWLMLMIIALRNIVEVGGLSISLGQSIGSGSANSLGGNATSGPLRGSSIIPKSFTIFPKWTGQVLGPFLLVLGSEMLVDWLKHAYINKFNNTKPAIYGRFLDVLAKDYYSHAFADQSLTKRLGLPVLPLSCLFIRASLQTYHMFLATHMPLPLPSTATSLVESESTAEPATTAALAHIDQLFRRALGRSSWGGGSGDEATEGFSWFNVDDIIALATMLIVFLVIFLTLLAIKLCLGMVLLTYARARYRGMKVRESMSVDTGGKRVGGWGVVEVDEDKRRWIYKDDPEGLKALRDREARARERDAKGGGDSLGSVSRYSMVAKRIW